MRDEEETLSPFHSSLIPHPSSLSSYGLLVSSESQARRLVPGKLPGALETFGTQRCAQVRIINHPRHGLLESFHVKRINQEASVSDHLRQARPVAGDDGRAALHRFERRQPEALKV